MVSAFPLHHGFCIFLHFSTFFVTQTCSFTDQVNDAFVDFIIDVIESAGGGEHGEEVVDALVPLILAFNQHFVGRIQQFCNSNCQIVL